MKTVLITGASDGIGKAIAQLLDEKGYELYLFGRSQVKMDALNINHCKGKYTFDLKDRTAFQALLEYISEYKSMVQLYSQNTCLPSLQ